jgi:hypothetical protein
MTKISQYSTDVNITGNDKWIGSDAQNFLITKNFTPNNLANYFNGNNVIDIGTSIRYMYQTLLPGEAREQGTISFETEIGPQVNFSDITTFLIAKNTLKGNTVTQYLDFLVDGKVLLSRANNINIFGYYKITSIEPWIPNTNFFVVEVDFLSGNGFIYEDLDYLISLVDKVQDIPPPVWGSITGDIEDQTDLINYIASQVITPTIQEVVTEGNSIDDNKIDFYELGSYIGSIGVGNSFLDFNNASVGGYKYLLDPFSFSISTQDDSAYVTLDPNSLTFNEASKNSYFSVDGFFKGDLVNFKSLSINFPTSIVGTNKTQTFQDASGTIALISDIPTTSGIPHATASGTDTYTATVPDVIAYNDADAYLIRFTNGNTTGATLNINGLGAIPLYRNNDGPLLGGDILDGGEMLCIYNSTLVEFQVIGISPNSLIAYVTNADSVALTKGMPVYAFGGQGDRMTVKRANNTGDATSAQTVGLVLSTSIAAGQKGVIMMQGLLDGLSILPTATFADGDAVYLGATNGSITNVKPYAPNHLVYLGVVTTASNGSAGRLYVRVQNGYELDELHNVDAHNPNNNDGIFYNSTTQLWEHKNVLAVAAERRNANNSTNNNINYCGIAPADSLESASVWTITRLTITLAGAVTTANAINVKWTDRETTIYT